MKNIRIIIINYNQSNLTLNLIKELNNQIYDNFEIVIVDNNSSEIEKKILKENLNPDVKYVFSNTNLGYAKGNNLGIKYQTGVTPDYYFILNNDIIINDKYFMQKMVSSFNFETDKNVIAVSPLVDTISLNLPVDQQIQVRRILPKYALITVCCSIGAVFFKKLKNMYLYKDKYPLINKYTECDTINGAAFIIDSRFLLAQSGFDENTFLFFEEIILGHQIKKNGGTCLLNGFVTIKHLQGASTNSNKDKLNIKMERIKYKSQIYYFQEYLKINKSTKIIYIIFKEIEICLKTVIKRIK